MSNNDDLQENEPDESSLTSYRFQIGVLIQKEEQPNTSIFVQPRFSKIAGDTEGDSTVSSGSSNAENSFDAHQAYISHTFSESLTVRAGRQEMIYGDQLLIGAVAWHKVGRAFDGVVLSYQSELGKTDLFSMTLKEESPYTSSNRDSDFNGIYHTANLQEIDELDLYYLVKQDLSESSSNSKSIVSALGIRTKSQFSQLDIRLELTVETVYEYNSTKSKYQTEDASQYENLIDQKMKDMNKIFYVW